MHNKAWKKYDSIPHATILLPERLQNYIIIIIIIIIIIMTNYVKFNIDKSVDSPLCRMCHQKGETINHILSECKMLAQKEYKRRHDNIVRLVHWKLCCKYDMSRGGKWYEHQPEGVVENEKCKILWDMTIQCDHVIKARRPDIVVVEKENNKAIIVDIASPWDHRVYEKEGEKKR